MHEKINKLKIDYAKNRKLFLLSSQIGDCRVILSILETIFYLLCMGFSSNFFLFLRNTHIIQTKENLCSEMSIWTFCVYFLFFLLISSKVSWDLNMNIVIKTTDGMQGIFYHKYMICVYHISSLPREYFREFK